MSLKRFLTIAFIIFCLLAVTYSGYGWIRYGTVYGKLGDTKVVQMDEYFTIEKSKAEIMDEIFSAYDFDFSREDLGAKIRFDFNNSREENSAILITRDILLDYRKIKVSIREFKNGTLINRREMRLVKDKNNDSQIPEGLVFKNIKCNLFEETGNCFVKLIGNYSQNELSKLEHYLSDRVSLVDKNIRLEMVGPKEYRKQNEILSSKEFRERNLKTSPP